MNLFKNHPPELKRLFFVEMWERFSYYGFGAILVLFMTADSNNGGLGESNDYAYLVYSYYVAAIFILCVPLSLLADSFLGYANSVFIGGSMILMGHISLSLPLNNSFYVGLVLIAIGTAFLKPSISSMVGELYSQRENSLKSMGMTLFYLSVSLGGLIGPFIIRRAQVWDYFSPSASWHFAFSLAAFGMFIALSLYIKVWRSDKKIISKVRYSFKQLTFITLISIFLLFFLIYGTINFPRTLLALYILIPVGVVYAWCNTRFERLSVIGLMFLISVVISAILTQMYTFLIHFIKNFVNLSLFGFSIHETDFLSYFSGFIILLGFVEHYIGKGSVFLKSKHIFYLGLLFAATGLGIIGISSLIADEQKIQPTVILIAYFLIALGEITIIPKAQSLMNDISNTENKIFTMSIWFVGAGIGATLSKLVSKVLNLDKAVSNDLNQVGRTLLFESVFMVGFALILFVFSTKISKRFTEIKATILKD